jgi:hypothetical protein
MRDVLLRELIGFWPVIALWAACLCGVAVLTTRAARAVSWRRIVRLLRDDRGSAYSIGYLLTLPLYMLFIALFIELSLIMVCKTGTVYAAFAAARVGIVWAGDSPTDEIDRRIEFAARRAFVPFASGLADFRAGRSAPAASGEAKRYLDAYKAYNSAAGNDRVFEKYVAAKRRYAFRTVRAEVRRTAGANAPWDEDLSVTVGYSYPFGTLGIGRALGQRGPDGFYLYPIETKVTLKSELPKTPETTLGINYFRLPR